MDPSPAIPRRRFVKLLAASAASLAMTSDPARAAAKTTERHRAATSAPPKSSAIAKPTPTIGRTRIPSDPRILPDS